MKKALNVDTFGVTQIIKRLAQQQNDFAKITNNFFNSEVMENLRKQQKDFIKITSTFFNSEAIQKLAQQQNELYKINSSLFNKEAILEIINSQEIEKIQNSIIFENEKSVYDDIVQILSEMSPDINIFLKSLKAKNYKKLILAIILHFLLYSFYYYQLHNELFNSDKYYKINRNNVRVRLTPSIENSKNIITKLNKNTFIEKTDSKNGWIKVRFELEDGIEKEGWIFRTMLTKMD